MKPLHKIYGQAEGPCGVPMRDDVAKAVEQAIAKLDGDCKSFIETHQAVDARTKQPLYVCRLAKAPASMDFKPDERADISLLTTDAVDRDREVVLPEGADWSQVKRAGFPATWCHDYYSIPMGRGHWVKRMKEGGVNGWLAKTAVHPKPDDWPEQQVWFGDIVWHLVRGDGKQSWRPGKSIGFIPTEGGRPKPEDIKKRPELAEVSWIIRKWIVLEWAYCTVQSNPDALVQVTAKYRAKGLALPDRFTEPFGLIVPDVMPSLDELLAGAKRAPEAPAPEPETRNQEPAAPALTRSDLQAAFKRAGEEALAALPMELKDALAVMRGRV